MKSRGQTELDEYIFTRPEMAKLLGISTNALRMRMRKGKCDLDYRFDGNQFKFKRPIQDRVTTMIKDRPQTTYKKVINRGATHKGQGKYPNDAFKQHNEMKIMNAMNGKFKSEAHRKEFEKLNEESLKQIDKNVRKEEDKQIKSMFRDENKYGGMLKGLAQQRIDEKFHAKKYREWHNSFKVDTSAASSSFNIRGRDYTDPFASNIDDGSVEIDPRDFPEDDREPVFSSKIEEEIWRLKNKK